MSGTTTNPAYELALSQGIRALEAEYLAQGQTGTFLVQEEQFIISLAAQYGVTPVVPSFPAGTPASAITAITARYLADGATLPVPVVPPVDPAVAQRIITQFYVGYYNRAPDPSGLAYWVNAYSTPGQLFYQNISQIAASFADPKQPETTALYPFLANPSHGLYADVMSFVTTAYSNLFGRNPGSSDSGVDNWATSIAKSLEIPVPVYGNPTIDNTAPVSASNALIALIPGATGNDATTIINKVTVGEYYDSALASHNAASTSVMEKAALSGVTWDTMTVSNAEGAINARL